MLKSTLALGALILMGNAGAGPFGRECAEINASYTCVTMKSGLLGTHKRDRSTFSVSTQVNEHNFKSYHLGPFSNKMYITPKDTSEILPLDTRFSIGEPSHSKEMRSTCNGNRITIKVSYTAINGGSTENGEEQTQLRFDDEGVHVSKQMRWANGFETIESYYCNRIN
jgi:hypothetical protein